jgi:hypothetical protein
MDRQRTDDEWPGDAERPQESGGAAPGHGGRLSRQRKMTAVLRLLRGEVLETISRGLGVAATTLSGWRDAFLAAATPTKGVPLLKHILALPGPTVCRFDRHHHRR